MSIQEKVEGYKKTLALFPNPQEKYQYLIEQAKKSEDFPTELRIDEFKINGCQSQVWLVPEEKDNKLYFKSDSDALIAKGLVTLIASIYSDEAPKDIVNSKIDLMEEFELGVILSPARRNGAFSMLKTIKEFSQKLAD
ncbi:MAG: SufE family protein [Actinomycetota bacterium]|jgi:cysteine desulfuration protein SufE|nr:SufE family protein [Actinomycetota bacterium]MDA3008965.1 SufE family protein [Actinomycetota bacterium]MDA3036968.1 SufE family protein [Actinomycetota bacterium]